MAIRSDIMEFYGSGKEIGRLENGIGPLELARTQELMRRYLPPAPGIVWDVGCGPGMYSLWLAGCGYRMHLVDPVPLHIERARRAAEAASLSLESARVGDAQYLEADDVSADAVILHGPLYHLTERTDRMAAIAEARRVLRPGGRLLAFAITRYASAIVGLYYGWVWNRGYMEMVEEELTSGCHHCPPNTKAFTTAFFHHPSELKTELEEAGMCHEGTFGVEGPAWMVPDFTENWKDELKREIVLELARKMEHEPVMSPHIVALAKKTARRTP
jgi:ubiquinone/menaquinone biosynthesis C-methylase UbiE